MSNVVSVTPSAKLLIWKGSSRRTTLLYTLLTMSLFTACDTLCDLCEGHTIEYYLVRYMLRDPASSAKLNVWVRDYVQSEWTDYDWKNFHALLTRSLQQPTL